MGLAGTLIDANVRLSQLIDSALPAHVRTDGNQYFIKEMLPRAFASGMTVYDLGSGSCPSIRREVKERLGLTVVGLDISAEELAAAPPGVYDRTIVADLCTFVGDADADAVVCQATLEHVPNTPGAIRALASTVKPGKRVFIFAPSRNAVFARINLLLPENVKRWLLFKIFRDKAQGHDPFPAYYDHCTPRQIETLALANGLEVEERHLFWMSSYFTFFMPAFVLWRTWQLLTYLVLRENAAETFAYVLRRRGGPDGFAENVKKAADAP